MGADQSGGPGVVWGDHTPAPSFGSQANPSAARLGVDPGKHNLWVRGACDCISRNDFRGFIHCNTLRTSHGNRGCSRFTDSRDSFRNCAAGNRESKLGSARHAGECIERLGGHRGLEVGSSQRASGLILESIQNLSGDGRFQRSAVGVNHERLIRQYRCPRPSALLSPGGAQHY